MVNYIQVFIPRSLIKDQQGFELRVRTQEM